MELQGEVKRLVRQTKQRSRWPVRQTLKALEIAPGSYYRWCHSWARSGNTSGDARSPGRGSMYEVLASERRAIVDYAMKHPAVRHRALAWNMLDDGVCAVSPSTVYRVLGEANLVCRWRSKEKGQSTGRPAAPTRPDELWQTDIRYTKVGQRNYYLLSFIDVYSRYLVYQELLPLMDGWSVSVAAAAAIETLPPGVRPTIQSDHGSGFIAKEFAGTLAESGVGHTLIRPHTPTDNGIIERCQRTIGELIEEHELENFTQAQTVIGGIIHRYNFERLHSSLSYLRPVDYYRGDPEALLAQRRRKLQRARELRKQENIKLRQRLIPWTETEHVA
jgi:transposase InsO family protein